jgi:hypothetical protein
MADWHRNASISATRAKRRNRIEKDIPIVDTFNKAVKLDVEDLYVRAEDVPRVALKPRSIWLGL